MGKALDKLVVGRKMKGNLELLLAALGEHLDSGTEIYKRLKALPGYGDEKSKIFVALLGKTQGVEPEGWREAAGKFGDDVPRSVADVFDDVSLGRVREWKKAQKAAKKDKQDRPVG